MPQGGPKKKTKKKEEMATVGLPVAAHKHAPHTPRKDDVPEVTLLDDLCVNQRAIRGHDPPIDEHSTQIACDCHIYHARQRPNAQVTSDEGEIEMTDAEIETMALETAEIEAMVLEADTMGICEDDEAMTVASPDAMASKEAAAAACMHESAEKQEEAALTPSAASGIGGKRTREQLEGGSMEQHLGGREEPSGMFSYTGDISFDEEWTSGELATLRDDEREGLVIVLRKGAIQGDLEATRDFNAVEIAACAIRSLVLGTRETKFEVSNGVEAATEYSIPVTDPIKKEISGCIMLHCTKGTADKVLGNRQCALFQGVNVMQDWNIREGWATEATGDSIMEGWIMRVEDEALGVENIGYTYGEADRTITRVRATFRAGGKVSAHNTAMQNMIARHVDKAIIIAASVGSLRKDSMECEAGKEPSRALYSIVGASRIKPIANKPDIRGAGSEEAARLDQRVQVYYYSATLRCTREEAMPPDLPAMIHMPMPSIIPSRIEAPGGPATRVQYEERPTRIQYIEAKGDGPKRHRRDTTMIITGCHTGEYIVRNPQKELEIMPRLPMRIVKPMTYKRNGTDITQAAGNDMRLHIQVYGQGVWLHARGDTRKLWDTHIRWDLHESRQDHGVRIRTRTGRRTARHGLGTRRAPSKQNINARPPTNRHFKARHMGHSHGSNEGAAEARRVRSDEFQGVSARSTQGGRPRTGIPGRRTYPRGFLPDRMLAIPVHRREGRGEETCRSRRMEYDTNRTTWREGEGKGRRQRQGQGRGQGPAWERQGQGTTGVRLTRTERRRKSIGTGGNPHLTKVGRSPSPGEKVWNGPLLSRERAKREEERHRRKVGVYLIVYIRTEWVRREKQGDGDHTATKTKGKKRTGKGKMRGERGRGCDRVEWERGRHEIGKSGTDNVLINDIFMIANDSISAANEALINKRRNGVRYESINRYRLTRFESLKLYTEGVEPHPGPTLIVNPPKHTCPFGHYNCPFGHYLYYYENLHLRPANLAAYRINFKRLARFDALKLYQEGIEPNPGMPSQNDHITFEKPACCPAGHAGTSYLQGGHGVGRYRYLCGTCQGTYSQKIPKNLAKGEAPAPAWTRQGQQGTGYKASTSADATKQDTPRQGADQNIKTPPRAPGGPRTKKPTPPPPYVGDDHITFGNMQGGTIERVLETYIHDKILTKASLHGAVESWLDEARAATYAENLAQSGKGRMHYSVGDPTDNVLGHPYRGTGCLLIIRSDIPRIEEEVIYKKKDGKAMGVHVTWHDRKLLILLTHNAHDDKKQAQFYQTVQSDLQEVYRLRGEKVNPGCAMDKVGYRECIWMSDNNHVDVPSIDSSPAGAAPLNPSAILAKKELSIMINANVDTYRTFNPTGTSTTRKNPAYASRLDTIHISQSLTTGGKKFIHAEHVKAEEYGVAHRQNGVNKIKKSDHDIVKIMYRSSDTIRPPKGFTFPSEILQEVDKRRRIVSVAREITAQKVKLEMRVGSDGRIGVDITTIDPEETQEKLSKAWQAMSGIILTEIKAAERKLINASRSKLQAFITLRGKKVLGPAGKAIEAQLRRARERYAGALLKVQISRWKRRHTISLDEEKETSRIVHSKVSPRARATPVTELTRKVPVAGKPESETSTRGILDVMEEAWIPIMQKQIDEVEALRAQQGLDEEEEIRGQGDVLERIAAWAEGRLTKEDQEGVTMEAIMKRENLLEAIRKVREHTSPGQDGIPSDVYRACAEEVVMHLQALFKQAIHKGEMTESMKESVTSMLYKGAGNPKGNPKDPDQYRPIAVTAVVYRILATAMAQRLALVMHRIIGDSQIGFQILRDIGENIDLMEEVIRYANEDAPKKGGVIAILDNAHAYDNVSRPFMIRTMRAFGLPDCFCNMMEIMNKDTSTRLKVNDTLGSKIVQTSGVKQGCPLSSMIFLCVMEVQLRMIREDEKIQGIEMPGREGGVKNGETAFIKERSLADDVAVFVHNPATSLPRLRKVIARFGRMSGQELNLRKSALVLLGKDAENMSPGKGGDTDPMEWWPGMNYTKMGVKVEKYHGVTLANAKGTADQWWDKAEKFKEGVANDSKVYMPRSLDGRIRLAQGRHVGKLIHTFKYQVPEQQVVNNVLAEIQKDLDRAIIGNSHWIKRDLAKQRKDDGGIGHIDIQGIMESIWATTITRAMEPETRPWKNFVYYYLRRTYGETLGKGLKLLTSNFSYALITQLPVGTITEKMRQAFKAYGNLPRFRPALMEVAVPDDDDGDTKGKKEEQKRKEMAGPRPHLALTPGKEIQVAYMALRKRDNVTVGIFGTKASKTARFTITNHIDREEIDSYALHTCTKTRVCMRRAHREAEEKVRGDEEKITATIIAIRTALVQGTMQDCSDKAGCARALIGTGEAGKSALQRGTVLFIGSYAECAYIPPEAILGKIELGSIAQPRTHASSTDEEYLRAMPVGSDLALKKFEEDMNTLCREKAREDSKFREEEGCLRKTKHAWSMVEVLRQMLFHNAYSVERSELGGRSYANTERKAKEWAEKGVCKIRDIYNNAKKRVLTAPEFAGKWPALKEQQDIYNKVIEAIPEEWHSALYQQRKGVEGTHTWWITGRIVICERWTERIEEKGKEITRHWRQKYEREEGSIRLRKVGEPIQETDQKVTQRARECIGRHVKKLKNIIPHTTDGGTKEMAAARAILYPAQLICEDCEDAPHDPTQIAIQPKFGRLQRHPMHLFRMGAKEMREIGLAQTKVIPTAWDHGQKKGARHYAGWYAKLPPAEEAEKRGGILKGCRHPAVFPRYQDVVYKVAISGLYIGAFRCKKKEDDMICKRIGCGVKKGDRWTGCEETVQHAFHACEPIARFWRQVIERWNAHTGEQLDPSDPKVTLLGDRGEGARAYTEEMWRVVHAACLWVINSTRLASKEEESQGKRNTSVNAMIGKVGKEVRSMAYARMLEQARCGKREAFNLAWVKTSGVTCATGKMRVHILSEMQHAQVQQVEDVRETVRLSVYTDGGYAPKKEDGSGGIAGLGICEFSHEISQKFSHAGPLGGFKGNTTTTGSTSTPDDKIPGTSYQLPDKINTNEPRGSPDELIYVLANSVTTDPTHPKYIGAQRQTNNTGECTALASALDRALNRPADYGPEDIWSDSTYAINMTKGTWLPKKTNTELILSLREKWEQVRQHRGTGTVQIRKVRAHTMILGNELADRLATLGMKKMTADLAWAREQMRAITTGNMLSPLHPPPPRSSPAAAPPSNIISDPRQTLGIG